MAIEINGKVYRNLQEQVAKNANDIEEIKNAGTQEPYTAGENITIEDGVISATDTTYGAGNNITITDTNIGTVVSPKFTSVITERIESPTDEEATLLSAINLSSGVRRSRIALQTDGEEAGSSIILQGTTSLSSEGTVEIAGETNFTTNSRITVTDGDGDVEEIAYLSDLTNSVTTEDTDQYINGTKSFDEIYVKSSPSTQSYVRLQSGGANCKVMISHNTTSLDKYVILEPNRLQISTNTSGREGFEIKVYDTNSNSNTYTFGAPTNGTSQTFDVATKKYLHRILIVGGATTKVVFNVITTNSAAWTLSTIPSLSNYPIDVLYAGGTSNDHLYVINTGNNDIQIVDDTQYYLIDFEGLSSIIDHVQEV